MSIIIRPALEQDQVAIKAIVRAARINPMGLDWPRFLVADEDGRVVGVGQVKPHGDGSRELASIAVIPERQKLGLGSMIVRALIAREHDQLHLVCIAPMVPYYARFGFQPLRSQEMPPYLRTMERVGRIVSSLTLHGPMRPVVMLRAAPSGR
jgi:N-acetylglutamate synthase-like GNAT family acetyltransferase